MRPPHHKQRSLAPGGLIPAALLLIASSHAYAAAASQRATVCAEGLFARMAQLVEPYGYPLEEHFAETDDGYLLRLFRIPRSAVRVAQPAVDVGPPVLLQHGLLDSSAGYVINGPGQALAFMLSDAGYDVWLSNSRGNTFSRNHTFLPATDAAFWAFSWDELALRDLPAAVRLVLDVTGQEQLRYVGHSQGCLTLLAGLSASPYLASKVAAAALMAPAGILAHIGSRFLRTLAALDTDAIFTLLGFHEFMPSLELVRKLEGGLCAQVPYLCINVLAAIAGYNPDNIDPAGLPLYVNFTPAGTSVMNIAHWSQAVRTASRTSIVKYDYGQDCVRRCNREVYGQDTPPVYNLSAVSTPLLFFAGGQDVLAHPLDVELIIEQLDRGVARYSYVEPSYGHLDFIWGKNAHTLIYPKLVQLLNDSGGTAQV